MAIGLPSAPDSARVISIQAPRQKNVPVSTIAKDLMCQARAVAPIPAILSLVADRMSDLKWINNRRQTDPKEITTEVRSLALTRDHDPMTATDLLEMKADLPVRMTPVLVVPEAVVAARALALHQVEAVVAAAGGHPLHLAKVAKFC